MRGINKKMLISIFTSVIVLITIVATTFAWVGIFTYANTENFEFNLKVSELDASYFLRISATGEKGSFSDEADTTEIKRQILMNINNWDKEYVDSIDSDKVDAYYNQYCVTTPSTCLLDSNGNLSDFYSINNKNQDYYSTYNSPKSCIKFDLYLTVDTKEGIKLDENGYAPEDIKINSNVLITDLENTLVGTLCKQKFTNLNPYKKMDDLPSKYNVLKSLPDSSFFDMNSVNSTRFSLSLYDPININDSYVGNETPSQTLIYHGGTQDPSVDNDVYDLGGILPEEYNTALGELLIIRPNYKNGIFADFNRKYEEDLAKAIERGQTDLALVEENSKVWNKPINPDSTPFLGVNNGIQTKQKVTICFWFEGWDSDCIEGINEKPVTLNLTFTAGIND